MDCDEPLARFDPPDLLNLKGAKNVERKCEKAVYADGVSATLTSML